MKHIMGPNSKSILYGVKDGDVQPNATDLRLGKVFRINSRAFVLSEQQKIHRGTEEILPDEWGWFRLEPGSYEVSMENTVRVGEGEAGWVITRSTLNRNGVFLTSGLYDSGYHGAMAAVMHVTTGQFRVMKGTRIGQYLSFDAESLHMYEGSYGLGKEFDKKYT